MRMKRFIKVIKIGFRSFEKLYLESLATVKNPVTSHRFVSMKILTFQFEMRTS